MLKAHFSALQHSKISFSLYTCHVLYLYFEFAGSQIIDMMLLVVDVVKGVQTQTAECLVIGEILCDRMIVVLNKVDLLPLEKRASSIEKVKT